MAYELCPKCGTRKHQIVACPSCGYRRSAKLWSPRPKNALGKKPEIPRLDESVSQDPAQKPMTICSRCHELVEHGGMENHLLSVHVRVVKKRKNRLVAKITVLEKLSLL